MPRPTDAEMAEWERSLNRSLDGVPMRARLREMFSALKSERARADTAEQHLAEVELAVDNSESLGAAIEVGSMFEDTTLVMMRLSLRSKLETAQRWAAWFAAERDWWLNNTPPYRYFSELLERVATAESAVHAAREQGRQDGRDELRSELLETLGDAS